MINWVRRLLSHSFLEDNIIRKKLTVSFSTFSFSNVVIKGMTILAPLNAPNTDGIDPGMLVSFSIFLCIEDYNNLNVIVETYFPTLSSKFVQTQVPMYVLKTAILRVEMIL